MKVTPEEGPPGPSGSTAVVNPGITVVPRSAMPCQLPAAVHQIVHEAPDEVPETWSWWGFCHCCLVLLPPTLKENQVCILHSLTLNTLQFNSQHNPQLDDRKGAMQSQVQTTVS